MSAPRTKIFVGHLPDGCRSEDLQILFSKFGTVTECDVINKYGFVHMRTPEEAEAAIRGLNNYNLKGSAISVEPSKSKLHPEPGAPGRARGGGSGGNMGPGFGNRRGGQPRNGFGPRGSSDIIRQLDQSSGDLYFSDRSFGQDRMRQFATRSSFDQPSAMFSAPTDDFRQRTFPAPVGTRDPYSAPPASSSRPESYDRFMTSANYIYTQRSPQRTAAPPPTAYDPLSSQTRPYGYYDSVSVNPNQPPTDLSRRPFY